jgi:hypothetical protein
MSRRPLAAFFVPIVIVCAGVVLLLNTLGILPWDSWSQISRFWPILVIAAGASILWRNLRYR